MKPLAIQLSEYYHGDHIITDILCRASTCVVMQRQKGHSLVQ
jgi:hypothetical protein